MNFLLHTPVSTNMDKLIYPCRLTQIPSEKREKMILRMSPPFLPHRLHTAIHTRIETQDQPGCHPLASFRSFRGSRLHALSSTLLNRIIANQSSLPAHPSLKPLGALPTSIVLAEHTQRRALPVNLSTYAAAPAVPIAGWAA